jgi:sec-independent protein translocase protein TatA
MHWLIIALLVVLLFGAKRLPDAARGVGRSLRILKSEVSADQPQEQQTPPPPAAATPPAAAIQATPPAPPAQTAQPADQKHDSIS